MHAQIKWSKQLDKKEYAAAETYLSLTFPKKKASKLVKKLKEAKTAKYHAKDILRASALPLLSPGDSLVKEAHEKILAGKRISPVLLARHMPTGRVILADGYHRLCSVYSIDEDAELPTHENIGGSSRPPSFSRGIVLRMHHRSARNVLVLTEKSKTTCACT